MAKENRQMLCKFTHFTSPVSIITVMLLFSILILLFIITGCNSGGGNGNEGSNTNTYYRDSDGDRYGDRNNSLESESQPSGYVLDKTDCDDNDATVNPNATELCDDIIDNDCDGDIDVADSDCGSIDNHTPIATITRPLGDSLCIEGDICMFAGVGNDTEDGILTDTSLIWTSSINGQIGTGTCLSTSNLSAGKHVITFTAKDSNGATDDKSANISVMPGYSWTMLNLPDSGQTASYTSTWGEDSDYSTNQPSYTDNGDGTITDHVTGLIWQKEDDGLSRTWYNAVNYCVNLTLADCSNWRLPTKRELISIVDFGKYNPAIDTNFFPNNAPYYWSSTTSGFSSAWHISLNNQATHDWSKIFPDTFVRCVRSDQ